MAFKSVKSYNEERYGGYFLLRNDGDYADVIFLYQSAEDVLVADVHYIKSPDYSGYVHCCGKGCPACAKGIRTQTKLFVPVYNISENEIQFFDRSMKFEPQLQQDVFSRYPNPSEYVFRITRHGASGSYETKYEIMAIGKNTFKPYAQVLAENNATMPEYYSTICKELTPVALKDMIDASDHPNNGYSPNEEYNYNAVPRGASSLVPAGDSEIAAPSHPPIETPTFTEPPEYVPSEADIDDNEVEDPVF